ncbi:MAG: hypothetical protein NC115_06045 [Bacteroidales bacterium]|nr:hypothetical protein [Bacteroidales bacterium]
MKHHFILLLIATAAICCSMSECKKHNFITSTETCPIGMYIDGQYYSSEEYTYRHWGDQPHSFLQEENRFIVEILRGIEGENGSRNIYLYIYDDGQLEIGKKYHIEKYGIYSHYPHISFYRKNVYLRYTATEGWIVFTSTGGGQKPYRLSGRFEFTAVNQKTGETMEVTEGRFENLKCL